jgi:hypothetical protein
MSDDLVITPEMRSAVARATAATRKVNRRERIDAVLRDAGVTLTEKQREELYRVSGNAR